MRERRVILEEALAQGDSTRTFVYIFTALRRASCKPPAPAIDRVARISNQGRRREGRDERRGRLEGTQPTGRGAMTGKARVFDMQRLVLSLFVILFVLIAISIFRVGLPILQDYPDHLARYWLLLGGAGEPALAPFYAVDWRRSSLVGVDLLAVLLGQVVPYTIAGKAIAFLALAGPPAGAACLSRTVFGRWHWWQLSFPLMTWSTTAISGFLAFQISIALALFFACVDRHLPVLIWAKLALRIAFGLRYPLIYVIPKAPAKVAFSRRISAYRSTRGRRRASGMLGMSS